MPENNKSNVRNILISIGVFFLLLFLGYEYIRYQEKYPSTDDAYVHGNIIYIASQISGQLQDVNVIDFQHVDKGMVIARISPGIYQARLAQAKAAYENAALQNKATSDAITGASAQIRSASAQLSDIQEKYLRNMALVKQGVLSKQAGDNLKSELAAAKNNLDLTRSHMQQLINEQGSSGNAAPSVKQAAAALSEAALNLSYTQILAPTSGILGKVKVHPGSIVSPGQAMIPLVQDHSFWVQANYKESVLGNIEPEMTVSIVLDMYPDTTFSGEVISISPASGSSFSLLPPENATGNWVKIPQRFPVRLSINTTQEQPQLRVGASASVRIDTVLKKNGLLSENAVLPKVNIDGKQ